MTIVEDQARSYEKKARDTLANARQKREEGGAFLDEMEQSARFFSQAGDAYQEAGNPKKAEANYRLAGKIAKDNKGFAELGRRKWNKIDGKYGPQIYADNLKDERKNAWRETTATASIIGILAGIFLLSANITGNAIANLSTNTTSWVGCMLLAIGIIAGFFCLKGRQLKR